MEYFLLGRIINKSNGWTTRKLLSRNLKKEIEVIYLLEKYWEWRKPHDEKSDEIIQFIKNYFDQKNKDLLEAEKGANCAKKRNFREGSR